MLTERKFWLLGLHLSRCAALGILVGSAEDRLLGTQAARSGAQCLHWFRPRFEHRLTSGIFLVVHKLHHKAATPKSDFCNLLNYRDLVGASGFEPEASTLECYVVVSSMSFAHLMSRFYGGIRRLLLSNCSQRTNPLVRQFELAHHWYPLPFATNVDTGRLTAPTFASPFRLRVAIYRGLRHPQPGPPFRR
jgi:hypothetical protein